jgi:hypothetical protein
VHLHAASQSTRCLPNSDAAPSTPRYVLVFGDLLEVFGVFNILFKHKPKLRWLRMLPSCHRLIKLNLHIDLLPSLVVKRPQLGGMPEYHNPCPSIRQLG